MCFLFFLKALLIRKRIPHILLAKQKVFFLKICNKLACIFLYTDARSSQFISSLEWKTNMLNWGRNK